MKAGIEVLQDVGFAGFTLQEVSRRAGVSIGAIYARTPSKEALLQALHERVMDDIHTQELRIVSDAHHEDREPRALIELLIHDVAEVMLSNADALRVFMRQGSVDRSIFERGGVQSRGFAQRFQSTLMSRRSELRHSDPELAIDITFRFVYCTLARWITHGPNFESNYPVTEERLIEQLGRAAASYLLESSV